ncbi:hypothetical protein M8C21_033183 [Ambrosia artemisiifolia]|uniref:Uncharacterized protein n=1 Tax=Ambrosia artemisiifolia TaxID=4212 RepID=A0AAD5BTQ7_AMBAR|nr:hypothetical protein M8C21_033183 [Ambrosia artemisiifolia]
MAASTTSVSMSVALKTFFIVSAWVMAAVLVYSYAADGEASCYDPRAWWMQVAETDFMVLILPIIALFFTKESSWLKRIVFMIVSLFGGRDVNMGRARRSSLVIAKVIVTAIGCYSLGLIVYAYITDGFPFHMKVLTP